MKVFDSGKNFIIISIFLLSACTVSQPGQKAEYDDMYYNSEDRLEEAQLIAERQKNSGYEQEYPDKNTNPDYYAEEQTQANSREVNPYDRFGNRSRMNPNYYPGDYYGYSGRFNDPFYQDWQFRNGFYNDPWAVQSMYYGADPFFGGWNSGFSMYYGNVYDPYFGYSYNRWNRINAYNRGFYNGYWFNRQNGHGEYTNSDNGRSTTRGTGHSSRGRRDLRPNTTNNTAPPVQSDQRRSRSSYDSDNNNTSGSSYQRRSRRSNNTDSYQKRTKRSSGSSYQRRSGNSNNSSGSSYQRRRSSSSSSGKSSGRSAKSRRDD